VGMSWSLPGPMNHKRESASKTLILRRLDAIWV
jgi:hypothetical protein